MKRRTLIGGMAAAGVAAAAGLYRFTDIFVKHYPPTPYDDLLVQLVDRQEAARLGAHVADAPDAAHLAAQLRAGPKPDSLGATVQADVAAGRTTEVDGWVVPRTLALLSALASKV